MKTSDLPVYTKKNKLVARMLRRNMTCAEGTLWGYLRRRQLGLRFRRQFPVGNYIVDFIALEIGLVVEIDGGQHYGDRHRKKDQERTRYLCDLGLTVIRFNNDEVRTQTEAVLNTIHTAVIKLRRSCIEH